MSGAARMRKHRARQTLRRAMERALAAGVDVQAVLNELQAERHADRRDAGAASPRRGAGR